MNNKYFKLIQVIVTSLAFYYLYNFFRNEVNTSEIDLQIGTNSLLVITLFFLVNNLHSLGWSNLYTKEQNFNYRDTYLFAMKSHIGKYSFVKFGNFFIRLSQNYEQTKKKDFLAKAVLEQTVLVIFGISFGICRYRFILGGGVLQRTPTFEFLGREFCKMKRPRMQSMYCFVILI